MDRVAIVGAFRTPIGKFMGALAPLTAVELGAHVVRGLLERTGVSATDVEEVILGQARQLGSGPNPARQAAILAGCPDTTPAWTLNKACGSSLKAIDAARAAILLDGRSVVVAGGMESMTNIPFLLPQMRRGYRLGHQEALDGNFQDGFTCGVLKVPMGMTAEYLADEYHLSREDQDRYALQSHQRAAQAQREGRFADEILPVPIQERGATRTVEVDEHVRHDVSMAALTKLPPVFRPKDGTVHAGNSSGITDGAAAVLVMREAEAQRRGIEPLAFLGASTTAGVPPRIMGIGPVPAVRNLLARTGTTLADYDLVEVNEAFSAQMLACQHDLELDPERTNVNGGAIALGHPIGATGARIVVTLLHEMRRRRAHRGLAALCMSGGMGMALALENPRA
ncbi:MAG: acetyl-CoA C-acetyltransferase [Planctomycetes bacterium]|nr:acetyl-CoA C-acetyltransferase [Planctomycetota bacterium]